MDSKTTSRFEIERDGVRIEIINNDPDGLPSYNRAFIFKGEGEVSVRHAWDIARFLTRHAVRAGRLQLYKGIRRTLGLSSRPREP